MNRKKTPLLLAIAVVLVASACLVTLPVPVSVSASPSPAAVQTKANKPAVSTAVFTATKLIPTLTPSITMTPFPSITPLPTATATATETPFGFFPSPTAAPPTNALVPTVEGVDPDEGFTTEWGSESRCSLIDKSPANWTQVPASGKYKVSWTLLNSGTKTWQANEMILTYIDGARLTTEKKASLIRDVRVGQTITPVINIYPPRAPGNYRAVWGLRTIKTGRIFCMFTIKVTVK
ncbi:MAG: NBR1-Ig-like domain-containing protein [Chloroflexi bacterium]|nr:NBR1-Ig-like domain-containing protein [Chloroflexota bacterium]